MNVQALKRRFYHLLLQVVSQNSTQAPLVPTYLDSKCKFLLSYHYILLLFQKLLLRAKVLIAL